MKRLHKFPEKRIRWTAILIIVMILSSAFTLLDAFIIPKSYVVVVKDQIGNSEIEIQDDTEANNVEEVEASTSSTQADEIQTEVIITDHSYIDEHINISIEMIEKDGVVFYVADVQLSDISFLKTAFANNTFGKNITQTTSEMAEANNAIFAINGYYYGFRDTGLVIRNGVLYRDFSSNFSNDQSLTIDSEGNLGIVATNESTGTELIDSGTLQGLTFGPTLVLDGEVYVSKNFEVDTKSSSNLNPRTAIGQISPLHYIFIVVDGRSDESKGMTLQELAQEFVDRGATVAYNLDGGGSAAMWLNGNVINYPTSGRKDGERNISDIIYIGN
jgi:exopolysaccharide biosynthesis protein